MGIVVKNRRSYKGDGEYIGRPSILGNPFAMKNESERMLVIRKYNDFILANRDKDVLAELDRLTDIARDGELVLICWCAPRPCHGDVLKEIITKRIALK